MLNIEDNSYFNLNYYEQRNLLYLIEYNKKFDGFNKVDFNWIDRIVKKEHKYGYNRMLPFFIWILTGLFIPCWLLFIFLLNPYINNIDINLGISFFMCFIIGIIIQILYDKSCDKIDYNSLINKNLQMNIFDWMKERR